MQGLDLTISGMSCSHCIARVSRALHAVAGIVVHDVQIGSARVSYDPAVVSLDMIHQVVADAGHDISATQTLDAV